jgi:hypothetical protein
MTDIFGFPILIGDIIIAEGWVSFGVVIRFSKAGFAFVRVYVWKMETGYKELELSNRERLVRTHRITNLTRFLKAKELLDSKLPAGTGFDRS